eukprot:gene32358-39132_t
MSAPQWLGLLRWSLAYSDGTQQSEFSAMSQEDKEWLTKVLKEGVRDDVQRMQEVSSKMQETYTTLQQNVQAEVDCELLLSELDELQEIVENIDMAQIYAKCNLHTFLLDFAYFYLPHSQSNTHAPEELRQVVGQSMSILATVCQNNLVVQDKLLGASAYTHVNAPPLSTQQSTAPERNVLDHLVYVFVLYAISALVRGHAVGEESVVHFFLPSLRDKVHALLHTASVSPNASPQTQASLLSRFLFLTHYLLVSDHASSMRIRGLVDALCTWVWQLAPPTDMSARSMRDNLLLAMLHTQYGHEQSLKSGDLASAVRARLEDVVLRLRQCAGEGGEDDAELQEEKGKCVQLLEAIEHPVVKYPHTNHTQSNTTPPTQTNANAEETSGGQPAEAPVLLLGASNTSAAAPPSTY